MEMLRPATRLALVGPLIALAACGSDAASGKLFDPGAPTQDPSTGAPPDAADGGTSADDASTGTPPDADDGGLIDDPYPLLSKVDNRHKWARFCENAPDDAALPRDPRSLVTPGVDKDKAVVFNAYWSDCDNPAPMPTNCGEYRQQVEQGFLIGQGQGQVGTAHMFGADYADSFWTITAAEYNKMWQGWGLKKRPNNYDELVAERHGSPLTPFRNPYPLPGEDPNKTNGGSGQLPLVYTQLREADGKWTGNIAVKLCTFCHSGALDTDGAGPELGTQYGGAGSIGDFHVAFRDFAAAGADKFGVFSLVNIATNRGTGAIDQFQLGFILFSNGDLSALPMDKIISSGAIGTIKSPPWWNLASRPQKFHGAVLPTDSARIDMAAYYPVIPALLGGLIGDKAAEESLAWADKSAIPFQLWAESLRSPNFPGPIDEDLATAGAVLFHELNMWDDKLSNPVPKPEGGNGSCASCHGVYSDRYANDPNFLETPELKGVAGRLISLDVIGTDPVYTTAGNSLKNEDGSISEAMSKNMMLYCGFGGVGETMEPRMLAPPLYGIWASAPYLHNGSIPNIWALLDPSSDRPRMWKRVSREKPAGLDVIMGYDTDVNRAYDFDKLGWKYEEVLCGEPGTTPGKDCDVSSPDKAPPNDGWKEFYQKFWFGWNLPLNQRPPLTNQEIEDRKVYNTWRYSQGNQGHEFTSVLTHSQRLAILEYLKTL